MAFQTRSTGAFSSMIFSMRSDISATSWLPFISSGSRNGNQKVAHLPEDVVDAENEADLIEQIEPDEGGVEAAVGRPCGDDAEDDIGDVARRKLPADGLDMVRPLDRGIDDVDGIGEGERAEEPAPTRI